MKPEIAERIRRPKPDGHVLEGSLPVISFGDPDRAQVATISLNPSPVEFRGRRGWLAGPDRRLHSLVSLGRDDPQKLTDSEVQAVAEDCRDYFQGNWYRGWFGWLEKLLVDSRAGSYLDRSACHLDLVQWATDPAQAKLPADEWAGLVADDLPFLNWQLDTSDVDIVLVNGAGVVTGVQQAGLVDKFESVVLDLPEGCRSRLKVHRAVKDGRLYLGWNLPVVQGLLPIQRQQLATWVRGSISDWTATPPAPPSSDDSGPDFIAAGTTVDSINQLVALLTQWAKSSTATTIGDVRSFGGRALVTVNASASPFVLNADTKRAAVLEFLAHCEERVEFAVVANQRGRINRVTFRSDRHRTPGWYAYTPTERDQEGPL